MERTESAGMRSVLNALRILEEIAARQPVGVSDLARALKLPKTSVQRSVLTLHQARWIRPADTETTRWRLSHMALTVGLAGSAESSLQEVALTEMRAVRDATGETVHLAVPEDAELVVIGRVDGTQPIRTFLQLGTRAPLHAAASGRAMLAAMSDSEIDRVLDAGVRAYTDHTILDRSQIWRELEQTRRRGYAVNEGEWRSGIAAVGSPILGRDGRPLAAISVSMPVTRFHEVDLPAVAELVITAARRTGRLLREDE